MASPRSGMCFPAWPRSVIPALAIAVFAAAPAGATYHFMQIEQVIGGVNGDTRAQAIQLRARFDQQNILAPARLVVRDARGLNPVVLFDFSTTLPSDAAGARILVATAEFAAYSSPTLQPDFVLASRIPDSYLAAGTLCFETDDATLVVFRVCWGGAAYTGPTTGSDENDDDGGDYGPAFPGPLPAMSVQALQFLGSVADVNTTNAASFALTAGAAAWVNNAGASFNVAGCTDAARDPDGNGRCDDTPIEEPPVEDAVADDVACGMCGTGATFALLASPLGIIGLFRRIQRRG